MDSFQRLIKPQVYNWIHGSIHEVIHMNYKDLQNGTVFPQAVTEFIEWCGEEYYLPSAMRKTANEELWNLQQKNGVPSGTGRCVLYCMYFAKNRR